MTVRELVGLLPGWMRTRYGVALALLLVVVPVAVSLLRDSHFDTTVEVFPTTPPGNAGASSGDPPGVRWAIANSGFRVDTKGWRAAPGSALRRSTEEAHSGTASLASHRDRAIPSDGRLAATAAVLPAAGRYSVQARVRLPRGYSGAAPEVEFEGFSGSRRVARSTGDPMLRERWQLVSSEYVVEPHDTEGVVVLRGGGAIPEPRQVIHWDDVRVLSSDRRLPPPSEVNLVQNPGFEHDRRGWGDGPEFKALRSERLAHTGSASLRSSTDQRAATDTNAGHTYIVFPSAGTYRVKAWVYVPSDMRAGRPGVFLEGFSGSTRLAQRLGHPGRRGTWQWVSSDYAISPQDLEGSVVLRDLPAAAAQTGAFAYVGRERVLYWDDVSVTVPRPDPPDARAAAAALRAALQEPQLRSDISRITGDAGLYDPRRATIERSPLRGALSFIVRVTHEVPEDANKLAGPLRATLFDAGRRGTLRQAEKTWQQLIATVGESLPPGRRDRLQRRAEVVRHLIGAQPAGVVVPPAPVRTPLTRARQLRVHEARQDIISRLGANLPPWQRTLVQLQADDVQRMVAADTAEFVVLPPSSSVEPRRPVDRLLADLPGPFPTRVGPVWAATAGLMCALLLMLIAMTAAPRRADARRR